MLGWDKPPGGESRIRRAEFDVLIQINARGLRGPDYDHAKPAGTRRVLILGDSFAEGYYVDEHETARAVLEKRLNAGPCPGWEVVNGGTIAYSTDQEYLFFREEGFRYAPDLVTLLFYHNDLLYNARPRGPGGEVKPFFQVEDGRLVARHQTLEPDPDGAPNRQSPGRAPLQPWRGSIALRLLSNRTVDASPGAAPRARPPGPRAARRERSTARVLAVRARATAARSRRCGAPRRRCSAALKQDVEAHGARLAVLYIPARFEVNDGVWQTTRARYKLGKRWDPYVVYDRLKAILDAQGTPLLDPRDALRATETTGPPAYYTRDVHWNAVGNAVAAEGLRAWVEAQPTCRQDAR